MSDNLKKIVASEIVKQIKDGWVLGIGTGSTVDRAIVEIAEKIKNEKISIRCVCTSYESARLCEKHNLTVLDFGYSGKIDFGFDGIDAVNKKLIAIKGKGGALLKEKLLAVRCDRYIFIGDKAKLVDDLTVVPVPIEVFPEMASYVKSELDKLGAKNITLRQATTKYGAVLTESGFMVLDVMFNSINEDLEPKIKQITGVVESGLFSNQAEEVLIATEDKIISLKR